MLFVLMPLSVRAGIEAGQFDQLFSAVDKQYTPFSKQEFEDKKLTALQDKNPNDMYALGMMYLEGINTEVDYIQSREWLQKSSNLGNSNAMIYLAYLYTLDKRVTNFDKSSVRAKKWIMEAYKSGNPMASYYLGLWYENGIAYQSDYQRALQYYLRAADAKITNAYAKLFLFYYFGRGTEVNVKQAIQNLIKIKRESTNKEAIDFSTYLLGEIYMSLALQTNIPDIKFKLYELAWSHGKKRAADAIGDLYSEGVGVRKDYNNSERWYKNAVDSFESIYSMEKLGLMYLKGPGDIERDYTKAFSMFKRAAEIGGVTGAHYMGYMYYYGLGVDKDPELAKLWFERSKKNAERARKYGTIDNISYETDVDKILNR